MKVGIRFYDADFMGDLRDFMALFILPEFVEREEGHMVTHLTSSMIVELFNQRMPHVVRRSKWNDGRCKQDEPLSDYFYITEDYVYWDDQTDQYLPSWGGSDIEFAWTDGRMVY